MSNQPQEKDWKTFRKLTPELRERFLTARNAELISILSDEALSPTEQFWKAEERMGEIATVLRKCFDGHSRSKMNFFIIVMLNHGVMLEEDLVAFSEPIQERMADCIDR